MFLLWDNLTIASQKFQIKFRRVESILVNKHTKFTALHCRANCRGFNNKIDWIALSFMQIYNKPTKCITMPMYLSIYCLWAIASSIIFQKQNCYNSNRCSKQQDTPQRIKAVLNIWRFYGHSYIFVITYLIMLWFSVTKVIIDENCVSGKSIYPRKIEHNYHVYIIVFISMKNWSTWHMSTIWRWILKTLIIGKLM